MKFHKTIDEYIKNYPKEIQIKLSEIRSIIRGIVPKEAGEKISYGIPTFTLNGNLVHFGGFKSHIGFFPGAEAIEVFKEKLTKYETSKGTIKLPLDKPIPIALIKQITKFRVKQNSTKSKSV
jgi:uncharacterized protein YdhG (YjbR/CyaY superfamily)